MKGLAPKTAALIEKISNLDCLKPYLLVGGTALSVQLSTRLSEDLDFMSWKTSQKEPREVDWPQIKRELESVAEVQNVDILGFDHVEFLVDGVKVSFYANPNHSPVSHPVTYRNKIILADKLSIGAMKLEVMLRRSKFRDYYDIYSLLKDGANLDEMISLALKYSGHRLKSKNIISLISSGERFIKEPGFNELAPVYDISAKDIQKYIQDWLISYSIYQPAKGQ